MSYIYSKFAAMQRSGFFIIGNYDTSRLLALFKYTKLHTRGEHKSVILDITFIIAIVG